MIIASGTHKDHGFIIIQTLGKNLSEVSNWDYGSEEWVNRFGEICLNEDYLMGLSIEWLNRYKDTEEIYPSR